MTKQFKNINYFFVIIFGIIITYLNKDFRLDDALIYYRYIENFINGYGLVYNIGERFNAISSPLYIYISLVFSTLTREVEMTQLILNGLLIISAGISLAYLFYLLDKPQIAFISSLLFVTTKFFYTTFGLETNLFVLLSILCIIFYFKYNFFLLSVFSSLLILTRGEGVFLIIILWGFVFKENRKDIRLNYILISIVILLISFFFNYFYYGHFLAQTLTAKMSHARSGLWGDGYSFIFNFNFLFRMAFNYQPYFFLLSFGLALLGFIEHIKDKILMILAFYAVGITLFHTVLDIQNYHWYYAIHFLLFVVLISYGISIIVNSIKSRFRNSFVFYLLISLIFIYPVLTQIELVRLLSREKPMEGYKIAGEWLLNNTPENSSIACVEIGHVGWYSKRKIIDIVGLVNKDITDNLANQRFDSWYELYKPTYLLLHDPPVGAELKAQKFVDNGTYVIDSDFKFPKYKIFKLKH